MTVSCACTVVYLLKSTIVQNTVDPLLSDPIGRETIKSDNRKVR